ncbi:MAG: PKD domain-containing protein, partial [Fidelibacterota bacterium]
MKISLSLVTAISTLVLCASLSTGADNSASPARSIRQATSLGEGTFATVMSVNNLSLWVTKHGEFPPNFSACYCATSEFPIGGPGLVYQEGFLYGAKVDDGGTRDGTRERIRVNGATHAHGLKAGKVLYDVSGNVTGAEDPGGVQVWRVRRDYPVADLIRDAASYNAMPMESVQDIHIQEMYDGYEYDWNNWPAADGAPYEELNGITGYQPATWDDGAGTWSNGDIPGYPGAGMTIWTVANDLPYPDGTEVATNTYGSPAVGVEMQFTVWAYALPPDNPIGNVIFKRFRMIYTGVAGGPADAKLDTIYFVNWSDPDLGAYTDDYVGCDTLLSLGYVYNANSLDDISTGDFGLPVAAGGYDFFQGPIVGGDTLGMTSFTYFGTGGDITDPDMFVYDGTLQYFNLMEGFLPRPMYPVQEPFINPLTGDTTKFALPGDPVTGQGWIDGIQMAASDRRMVMSTGPFQMALGDTQDIVVALIGGQGYDNLSSVTALMSNDRIAQMAYDNDFTLLNVGTSSNFISAGSTEITLTASTSATITDVTAYIKDAGGSLITSVSLYDDGAHNDGGAGDFVFGNTVTVAPAQNPYWLSLTLSDGTKLFDIADVKAITTDGPIVIHELSVVDDVNEDLVINPGERVHLNLSVSNDGQYTHPSMVALTAYSGPIAAMNYTSQSLGVPLGGTVYGATYAYGDVSTYSMLEISPDALPGEEIAAVVTIYDELGNTWQDEVTLTIYDYAEAPHPNWVETEHVTGESYGAFGYRVYEPSNVLSDHTYEISIIDPVGEGSWPTFNLVDLATSTTLLSNHALPDNNFAINIPITAGFKVVQGTAEYDEPSDYSGLAVIGEGDYNIDSYVQRNWAETARAVDTWDEFSGTIYPGGTTDWTLLSRDIEIRFTGVYESPYYVGNLVIWPVQAGTGSMATIAGARLYDLADHPLNPNPGTNEPFAIRIPFEVWDMDAEGGPQQIDFVIYDRNQDVAASGDFYAFNPYSRMYTHFLHRPYSETAADINQEGGADLPYLTWNLVWWYTYWNYGDTIRVEYGAPLTSENAYRFTPSGQNPPVPRFEVASAEVVYGEPIVLNAGASYDPDGEELQLSWDCDDLVAVETLTDSTAAMEFFSVGRHTVTLTVEDAAFEISSSQEVIVEPKLDNISIEYTYLDSAWLAGGNWQHVWVGDTLLSTSRYGSDLKVYDIQASTIVHQRNVDIGGNGTVHYFDDDKLFLTIPTGVEINAATGALYIYEVGTDWTLTPVLEDYLLPTDYGPCDWCNAIYRIQKVDQEWYFRDYYSVYRMDLTDPSSPTVLAQRNYSPNRPYYLDGAGGYIYTRWQDMSDGVMYVDALSSLGLTHVSTLDLPDSLVFFSLSDNLM